MQNQNLMSVQKSVSDRIIVTPSPFAKAHYLYVQEVGTLTSTSPHISSRDNLLSYLFMIVTKGKGTLTYNGIKTGLSEGDAVFIACNKPYAHESSAEDPWTLTWVHFYGRDSEMYYESYMQQSLSNIIHVGNQIQITDLLAQIYSSCKEGGAIGELHANRYLVDLIDTLFTVREKEEPTITAKLSQVHEFMANHINEKISLDMLSEKFYISKYHLSREYHRTYRVSLTKSLTAMRISKAKENLRFTDMPIESIGEICGFQDTAYFISVFRKAEGITPFQYRKNWRSLPSESGNPAGKQTARNHIQTSASQSSSPE